MRRQREPRYDPRDAPPVIEVPFIFHASLKPVVPDLYADLNGAPWWIALSEKSQRQIETAFLTQNVACLLIENVGCVVQLGFDNERGLNVIAIQVYGAGDHLVDLCLTELGVYLQETTDDLWWL